MLLETIRFRPLLYPSCEGATRTLRIPRKGNKCAQRPIFPNKPEMSINSSTLRKLYSNLPSDWPCRYYGSFEHMHGALFTREELCGCMGLPEDADRNKMMPKNTTNPNTSPMMTNRQVILSESQLASKLLLLIQELQPTSRHCDVVVCTSYFPVLPARTQTNTQARKSISTGQNTCRRTPAMKLHLAWDYVTTPRCGQLFRIPK